MARLWKIIGLAVLGIALVPRASLASKAYVTDSFRISLRRGPSIENKILRFIPSGLPVEINENRDGWSRVRLLEAQDGILEGWVLSRYLIKRLPWEEQAKALKQQNAALKEQLATIDRRWEEKIRQERAQALQLRSDYERIKKTADQLSEENDILRSSKRKKWFTAGGLVLFSGLIAGLIVGKPPRRRRLSF